MMQRELLEKQGELRAQDGFRERLRSFARQLADAEDLPEPAMRAVVRTERVPSGARVLLLSVLPGRGPRRARPYESQGVGR